MFLQMNLQYIFNQYFYIFDALPSAFLLVKNIRLLWQYQSYYTVIPGRDQESDRWTCIALSLAFVFSLR